MRFGKIDYINLLPFYVFIKRESLSSRVKKEIDYKKSSPTDINRRFKKREVNIAFISSVESNKRGVKCLNIGILSKREVKSVIVDRKKRGDDPNSATSNRLAKVLNIKGEVIIGDRALKLFYQNPDNYIDLAKVWYNKYNLPFVFARLCFNKKSSLFINLSKKFIKQKIKIPSYILNRYSKERGIDKRIILEYLNLIEYKIDYRGELSLKKFLKEVKRCKE